MKLDTTKGKRVAGRRKRNLRRFKCLTINNDERFDQVKELLQFNHLNEEEKTEVDYLLQQSLNCFHLPGDKLTSTHEVKHEINTTDDSPIHVRQYRFPRILKEELNRQVEKLLDDDIISPSKSPYNTPAWIVAKKPDKDGNKKWRLVLDFRKLNEKTVGDAYPIPNIKEIFDQLGGAKYFSVFDLASGFHQIKMDPKHKHKTAFSTPHGHYEFDRMPFGLKNAPASFQRLMDVVLSGLQGTELFVYMDDIVIYGKTLLEHREKYLKLVQRLTEANLKLQPDKCEFLRKDVIYLGHIITKNGIKPDPKKVEAVTLYPQPRKVVHIQQFLGMAGYYRSFVHKYADITKPLTKLTGKDVPFEWKEEQQQAFDTLKQILCEDPILQFPNFEEPFLVTTDASGYAIGGILSQGPIGKDKPASYVSRSLNPAERNYSTYEKEALAILYCVNQFRPYLYGRKFTVITDHKPLCWMRTSKDPTSRLTKWRLKLEEYDFDILYKAGKRNVNADALSRNPIDRDALHNEIIAPEQPVLAIRRSDRIQIPTQKGEQYRKGIAQEKAKLQKKAQQNATTSDTHELEGPQSQSADEYQTPRTENAALSDSQPNEMQDTPSSKDKQQCQPLHDQYPTKKKKRKRRKKKESTSKLFEKRIINYGKEKLLQLPEAIVTNKKDHKESRASTSNGRDNGILQDIAAKNDEEENATDATDTASEREDSSEEESDAEELDDRLEKLILGKNIFETRDSLYMRKDNLLYFFNTEGKPSDDQTKECAKKRELGNFNKSNLGNIKYKKKGNRYHFGLFIEDCKNFGTELAWQAVKKSIVKLCEIIDNNQIKSLSLPKFGEINGFPWKKFLEEIEKKFKNNACRITICNGLVTCPQIGERYSLISETHCSSLGGHKGVTKTYKRLRLDYNWDNMKVEIQNFIQQCLQCKLKKLVRVKTKQPMIITDTPGTAFEKIAMDMVGPFPTSARGNKYVLTMQDLLTKYCVAVPMPDGNAATVAEAFLRRFVCIYGAPKSVLTDQGTNFLSKLMKYLTKRLNIKQYKTTAFHPQSNGSLERSHHVLVEYLKQYIEKDTDWDNWLELSMFSYNTSVHEATKRTPFELVFGKLASLPSSQPLHEHERLDTYDEYLIRLIAKLHDLHMISRENLIQAKIRSKNYYDRKINPKEFTPGDYVFLKKGFKTGKFGNLYTGPYRVIETLDSKRISIQMGEKTKIVSADRLSHSYIVDEEMEYSE